MTTASIPMDSPLPRCGWCGAGDDADPATEIHQSRSGRCWIGCLRCGARTRAYTTTTQVTGRSRATVAWNRRALRGPVFVARRGVSARAVRRATKEPDERDILELVARLLVPGSYRVPVEGRSSKPAMPTSDVAAALGYMRQPLEREIAIAVATRLEPDDLVRLVEIARRRVRVAMLKLTPRPLDLSQPRDRFALRIVIYDALVEIVWPERRQNYGVLAKQAKMRKATYIVAHRCASSVLQEALNNSRRQLKARLLAWHIDPYDG